MSNNVSKRREDELIEGIVFTFKGCYISDINASLGRPLIVAQLAACLLEQLSGYLYEGPVGERIVRFVATYLEPYSDHGLYGLLRDRVDERLPDRLGQIMKGIPGRLRADGTIGLDARLVLEAFAGDLEAAVNRALDDLRSDRQLRQQALAWVQDHPVVEFNDKCLYTDAERSCLMRFYSPLLKKHPLFAGKDVSVGFNFGEGGHLINVMIDNFPGRKNTKVPLEIFIELMGLKAPAQVLLEAE